MLDPKSLAHLAEVAGNPVAQEVGKEIGKKAAEWAIKAGASRLFRAIHPETAIAAAVTATVAEFEGVPDIERTLASWTREAVFPTIVERFEEGDPAVVDDAAGSLAQYEKSTLGPSRLFPAKAIAARFFDNLLVASTGVKQGTTLVARRLGTLHEEVTEGFARQEAFLSTALAELKGAMVAPRSEDPAVVRRPAEERLHGRVDVAVSVIRKGHFAYARDLLESVRRDADGEDRGPSADLAYRIAMNLGVCRLRLDDDAGAGTEFATAAGLFQDRPDPRTNAAVAALRSGATGEALGWAARARAIAPDDGAATAAYVEALYKAEGLAAVDSFLCKQPWAREDPVCLGVLSQIFLDQGMDLDAERAARTAVARDDADAEAHSLLAVSIVTRVQRGLAADPPATGRLDKDTVALLEEAERELTRALELLGSGASDEERAVTLVNRSVVRSFMDRYDEAMADNDAALAANPHDPQVLRNRGILLGVQQRFAEAAECLHGINDPAHTEQVRFLLAECLVRTNRAQDAVTILQEIFDQTQPGARAIRVAEVLAGAYRELGDTSAVKHLVRTVADTSIDEAEALAFVAEQEARDGNYTAAIKRLEKLIEAAPPGNQRARFTIQLADTFFLGAQYPQAARLYADFVDPAINDRMLQRAATALHRSGAYGALLSLADKVRAAGTFSASTVELEAHVLEEVGDVVRAGELYEDLFNLFPESIGLAIRAAACAGRRVDASEARRILERIPQDLLHKDARALMDTARVRALIEDQSLTFAYRARQIAYVDEGIQRDYFLHASLRLVPEHQFANPPKVVPDTTVRLVRSGDVISYTIHSDDMPRRTPDDLGPSDPIALVLLGKGARQWVSLGVPAQRFMVRDIRTRYRAALEETGDRFGTWYPGNDAVRAVKRGSPQATRLIKSVETRTRAATAAYLAGQIPLAVAAKQAGISIPALWWRLTRSSDARYVASLTRSDASTPDGARLVVLDTTAVLAIVALGLGDPLKGRFDRVLVPQAVLDEILEALARHVVEPIRDGGSVGSLQLERREFMESVRDFIVTCEVASARLSADAGKPAMVSLASQLGHGGAGALWVAAEHSAVLYADDPAVRLGVKPGSPIAPVWSYQILGALNAAGLLTDDAYNAAQRELLRLRYRFLPRSFQLTLYVIRANRGRITPEVASLFDDLRDPHLDVEAAIRATAELLHHLYLDPILRFQRRQLLDYVLRAISDRRSTLRVAKRVTALLPYQSLIALPTHHDLMLDIAAWEAAHGSD